jgi:hypothetical protein
MFYTIYKTTNTINGKFYIGKHKTKNLNDGYMGSGKLLKRAIEKYGVNAFHKEILHVFDTEAKMNAKEKELVVINEMSYNLCEGGQGGFDFINRNGLGVLLHEQRKRNPDLIKKSSDLGNQKKLEKAAADPDWWKEVGKKISTSMKKRYETHAGSFTGKSHTQQYKDKMSLIMKDKTRGERNSQYGTCWITNGNENKKIKKDELLSWIEIGYNLGRTM